MKLIVQDGMWRCEKCSKFTTANGPLCFSCWNCAVHYPVMELGNEFFQVLGAMDWFDALRVWEENRKRAVMSKAVSSG